MASEKSELPAQSSAAAKPDKSLPQDKGKVKKPSCTELPRQSLQLQIVEKLHPCAVCGELFAELVRIDKIQVCKNCAAQKFSHCFSCGLPTHVDVLRKVRPDKEEAYCLCVECYHRAKCPRCSNDAMKKTCDLVVIAGNVCCKACANPIKWHGIEDPDSNPNSSSVNIKEGSEKAPEKSGAEEKAVKSADGTSTPTPEPATPKTPADSGKSSEKTE